MKKLLVTLLLFFLLSNNANSNDKFIGKWISINTGSLFEIIRLDNSYEVYMLYSARHFRKYEPNSSLIAKFEKKTTGYSGSFKALDNNTLEEFFAKAKFKYKDGKIKINVKGKNPSTNKKFKFIVEYEKYNNSKSLLTGEELFGFKIGNSYKDYKYIREFSFGNDMIGYRPTKLMESPKPHKDFGAYIVEVTADTNQIFNIKAFHKRNSGNLTEGQCLAIMKPFRNFVPEKYKTSFIVAKPNSLTLKGKKIGDVVGNPYDYFYLYNENYRKIYSVIVGCMKGDLGQYIGYISLNHFDLEIQDYNYSKKNKKKDVKEF